MGHAQNKRERLEQMEILLQFADEGLSIYQLAEQLGCDPSTAHRCLKDIRKEHELIEVTRGHYRLDPSQSLSNIRLYPYEALSIYLALRRFIRQTSHAPDFMISALQKVAPALLQPELVETMRESIQQLQAERPASPAHSDIWKTILRGWMENIVVRIEYQKPRERQTQTHEIEPYLFEPAVLSQGTYFIAWSQTRSELRTFKVDRIQRAALTTLHFEKRDELNVNVLLRHAWAIWYGETPTRVELLFAPVVADRVMESVWHPLETKTVREDGSVHWTVELAGTLEVLSWIRGWGADVKVLAPADLRQRVADDLRRAAAQYEE